MHRLSSILLIITASILTISSISSASVFILSRVNPQAMQESQIQFSSGFVVALLFMFMFSILGFISFRKRKVPQGKIFTRIYAVLLSLVGLAFPFALLSPLGVMVLLLFFAISGIWIFASTLP